MSENNYQTRVKLSEAAGQLLGIQYRRLAEAEPELSADELAERVAKEHPDVVKNYAADVVAPATGLPARGEFIAERVAELEAEGMDPDAALAVVAERWPDEYREYAGS